jgi:hypothetical protein
VSRQQASATKKRNEYNYLFCIDKHRYPPLMVN